MKEFREARASEMTTMRCGGTIARLYEPDTKEQLAELLGLLDSFIVLGGGSNMIFGDEPLETPVIRLGKGFGGIERQEGVLAVGASVSTAALLGYCLRNALTGLEFLTGIPGTLGGALWMNAGTVDRGVMDTVLAVECLDREGTHTLARKEVPYRYRWGGFPEGMVITGARLEMDSTPCIIEAHVNDDIVFIEIARGINREKIDLLRFKIRELLDLYGIQKPRVLLMISDMELSFVDGSNLEFLLETVVEASGARTRNIKILARSSFVREFVAGRPEFSDIEVLSSLEFALDGLVADAALAADAPEDKAAIITDRILRAQPSSGNESVTMRFEQEKGKPARIMETAGDLGGGLEIAVVDDDFVIQELLKTTFGELKATVSTFANGRLFLDAVRSRVFDLVFLDLRMPEVDGFGVLAELHAQDLDMPIIVLSAVTQRESVVKAFQAGVKSYLVKPLKPEHILRKTLEILKANF